MLRDAGMDARQAGQALLASAIAIDNAAAPARLTGAEGLTPASSAGSP